MQTREWLRKNLIDYSVLSVLKSGKSVKRLAGSAREGSAYSAAGYGENFKEQKEFGLMEKSAGVAEGKQNSLGGS